MKATIKDIARAAGVSPSTVSRALHNNPRISESMRKQIQDIARDMNFHPNQMARSLVSRKTRIVGIVFPLDAGVSLGHPFYPAVLQGLGHVASERRYHMLLGTGSEAVTSVGAVEQMIESGYVSGLIVLAAEDCPEEDVSVPVVVIGRPQDPESRDFVDTDNVRAGYEATRYLLERGHGRIALIGYDKQFMVTVDRRRGYEQALSEAGIPFRRDWVVHSRFIENTTDNALLSEIFTAPDRPTAVVSMDDALSIGLTSSLDGLGLSVPGDVSVVSFNNTEASRYHNPPLTSYDVNPFQLGASAMTLMLDRLKGKLQKPTHVEVPFKLVERDSVRSID